MSSIPFACGFPAGLRAVPRRTARLEVRAMHRAELVSESGTLTQ